MFDKRRETVQEIVSLTKDEQEMLYSALNMHGHVCGGMPMGFAAGKLALKMLDTDREANMDKSVILFSGDRHAAGCFADGVQFATGCTFGKGLFKKEPKGKFGFMLIDKIANKAVTVTIKADIMLKSFESPFVQMRKKGIKPTDIPENIAIPMFKRPFSVNPEELFIVKGPFHCEAPKGKGCFNLVVCSKCGDAVAENYIQVENNERVCIDCWSFK